MKQAWGHDSGDEQNAVVVLDKATAEQVRDYLIELLPLENEDVQLSPDDIESIQIGSPVGNLDPSKRTGSIFPPQQQLEQVGSIVIDSRLPPMTINVTGNVYINQIEKGSNNYLMKEE